MTTKPTSAYAHGALPDRVIEFETTPDKDMYVQYMMMQYQTNNPKYSDVWNNCMDYANYGLQIALDKKIDATETQYGVDFDTPNSMFNQAKQEKGATILKDASEETKTPTSEIY